MKSVSIGIYNTQAEAEAAQQILARNGIRAVIIGHERGAPSSIMGGLPVVELLVGNEDEEQAKGILGAFPVLDEKHLAVDFSELVAEELAGGADEEVVAQLLVARGWPEVTAREYVRAKRAKIALAVSEYEEQIEIDKVHRYRSRAIRGSFTLAAGIILTIYTYFQPGRSAFDYLWWGIALFGAFEFISGIKGWYDHR